MFTKTLLAAAASLCLLAAALPAAASDPLDGGPIVPVEETVDTVEGTANVPVRDTIEGATAGRVGAHNASSYPDYLQGFAKTYARSVRDAALGLLPGDLPRPEPGSITSIAAYTGDYVDRHTSPASLVALSETLAPPGLLTETVNLLPIGGGVAGLDAANQVNRAVFGQDPPQQGVGPYAVTTAVGEAQKLALNEQGPGQKAARGALAGLLGQSTDEFVFDGVVNPALKPAAEKVGCFGSGSWAQWAACANAQGGS